MASSASLLSALQICLPDSRHSNATHSCLATLTSKQLKWCAGLLAYVLTVAQVRAAGALVAFLHKNRDTEREEDDSITIACIDNHCLCADQVMACEGLTTHREHSLHLDVGTLKALQVFKVCPSLSRRSLILVCRRVCREVASSIRKASHSSSSLTTPSMHRCRYRAMQLSICHQISAWHSPPQEVDASSLAQHRTH